MSEQRNVNLFVSNLGSIVGPDRILYKPGERFPVERIKPEIVEMYLDSGQLVGREEDVGDPIDTIRTESGPPVKGPKEEGGALTEREFNLKSEAGGNEAAIKAERDRLAKEAAAREAEQAAAAAQAEADEVAPEPELEAEEVSLADFEDEEMSVEEARELGLID